MRIKANDCSGHFGTGWIYLPDGSIERDHPMGWIWEPEGAVYYEYK